MKTKKVKEMQFVDISSNNPHNNSDISLEIKEAKNTYLSLVKDNNIAIGDYVKKENDVLNGQHNEKSIFGFSFNLSKLMDLKSTYESKSNYDLKSIYFENCKRKFLTLQTEAQNTERQLSSNTYSWSKEKILSTFAETNKQLAEIRDLIKALHTSSSLTSLLEDLPYKKEKFETYVNSAFLIEEVEDAIYLEIIDNFNTKTRQLTITIHQTKTKLEALEKQEHLSTDNIEKALKEAINLLDKQIIQLEQHSLQRTSILELLQKDGLLTNKNNELVLNFNVSENNELEEEIELIEIPLEDEEPVALLNEEKQAEMRFTALFENLTGQVHNIDYLESSQNELKAIKNICFEDLLKTDSEKSTQEAKLTSKIQTYNSAHAKLEILKITVEKQIQIQLEEERRKAHLLQCQLEAAQREANEELAQLKTKISTILQLKNGILSDADLNEEDALYIQQAISFCNANNTIERTSLEFIENTILRKKREATTITNALERNLNPLFQSKYDERQSALTTNIRRALTRFGARTGFPIDISALTTIQNSITLLGTDKSSVTLKKINDLIELDTRYNTEMQRINSVITQEEEKRQQSHIIREINVLIAKVEEAKTSINDDAHPAAIQLNTFKTELTNAKDSYTALSASLDDMKNRIKTEINRNLTPATLENLTTKDAWKITKFFHHLSRLIENLLSDKPLEGNIKISWFANNQERELAASANGLCLSLDTINEPLENPQINQVY